jgi:hypothetical protein
MSVVSWPTFHCAEVLHVSYLSISSAIHVALDPKVAYDEADARADQTTTKQYDMPCGQNRLAHRPLAYHNQSESLP